LLASHGHSEDAEPRLFCISERHRQFPRRGSSASSSGGASSSLGHTKPSPNHGATYSIACYTTPTAIQGATSSTTRETYLESLEESQRLITRSIGSHFPRSLIPYCKSPDGHPNTTESWSSHIDHSNPNEQLHHHHERGAPSLDTNGLHALIGQYPSILRTREVQQRSKGEEPEWRHKETTPTSTYRGASALKLAEEHTYTDRRASELTSQGAPSRRIHSQNRRSLISSSP
jgi:hypothetical protein